MLTINQFLPKYCSVLLRDDYREYVSVIIIFVKLISPTKAMIQPIRLPTTRTILATEFNCSFSNFVEV